MQGVITMEVDEGDNRNPYENAFAKFIRTRALENKKNHHDESTTNFQKFTQQKLLINYQSLLFCSQVSAHVS